MVVNCICSTAFCESAALREKPAQAFSGLNPLSFAALSSSPEGGAFFAMTETHRMNDKSLRQCYKLPLSGELARRKP